ncbi:MAG: outer membrane protein [Bradyrhizobium sp.]
MKKFLLGAVALIAFAAPAAAADLAARPYTKAPAMIAAVYDWSGFYIGANGGWGSSRKCWDIINNGGLPVVPSAPEGCHDATGGVAGGQIGYRWQTGTWVFGVEGQGDWADLKGSNTSLFFGAPFVNHSKIEAFGLLTGQVGYAVNNALFYVKGGAAVTSDKYHGSTSAAFAIPGGPVVAAGTTFDRGSETRWGGVVGVGLEYGFSPNWSAAIEYDHLFMGNRNVTMTAAGGFLPVGVASRVDNIRQDVDLVTVRVNYRWGGPVIAKY